MGMKRCQVNRFFFKLHVYVFRVRLGKVHELEKRKNVATRGNHGSCQIKGSCQKKWSIIQVYKNFYILIQKIIFMIKMSYKKIHKINVIIHFYILPVFIN